MDNLIKI
jgi:hypothetical protein